MATIITPLLVHQEVGRRWMLAHPRGIVADEMGMGKTAQALAAACDILNSAPAARILIICPKSVVSHWRAEYAQHVRTAGDLVPATSTKEANAASLVPPTVGRVFLATFEIWRLLHAKRHALTERQWRAVIVDEAHVMRSQATLTSKAVAAVHASCRWCLTGTPINNRLQDLVTLCKFLQVRPYSSPHWWQQNFAANGPEVQRWRREHLLRRELGALEGLPPLREQTFRVAMNPAEQLGYKALLANLLRSRSRTEDHTSAPNNSASKTLPNLLRLRLHCNHPCLVPGRLPPRVPVLRRTTARTLIAGALDTEAPMARGPGAEERQVMAQTGEAKADERSSKLAALHQFLDADENRGQKVVVFSQWTQTLDLVASTVLAPLRRQALFLTGRETPRRRRQVMAAFATSSAPDTVLLATMAAAGLGISLSTASRVVLLDKWWNSSTERQAVSRVHRLGQRAEEVVVTRFEVIRTIEQHITKVQHSKDVISRAAMMTNLITPITA